MSPRIGDSPAIRQPTPTPAARPTPEASSSTQTPAARRPEGTQTPATPRPEATQTPRPAAQPTPQQQEAQRDRFDAPISAVSQGSNVVKTATDSVAASQTRTTPGQRSIGPVNIGPEGRSTVEPLNTQANRVAGRVGTAASVAQLPGAAYTAIRDGRNAINDPSAENVTRAVGSGASAVSTAANAAKGAIETSNLTRNFNGIRDAAARTITERAPDAARSVVDRVAGEAAQNVLDGASRQVTRGAAARAAGEGLEAAARAGATAARGAAPHVLASTAGRAASRFVPGLNAGIAVADSAAFGAEVANAIRTGQPNVGKLATSGITALGSIAAATNIPVVSQAGAVVSTVSSLVGSFF
jgi:hypothetical protein